MNGEVVVDGFDLMEDMFEFSVGWMLVDGRYENLCH